MLPAAKFFSGADADRDGVLTKDEFVAAKVAEGHDAASASRAFDAADADNDDTLSPAEFAGRVDDSETSRLTQQVEMRLSVSEPTHAAVCLTSPRLSALPAVLCTLF